MTDSAMPNSGGIMFNPIKAAGSFVGGLTNAAKGAAKVKAMWERATADTAIDEDNTPQYKNILDELVKVKDRSVLSFGVLKNCFAQVKEESKFYFASGKVLWTLGADLFKHVLDQETPKQVAALEQKNDVA